MRKLHLYIAVFLMAIMLTGCIVNPYKSGMEALESGQYEEAAEQFKEAVKRNRIKRIPTEDSVSPCGRQKIMKVQRKLWETRWRKAAKRREQYITSLEVVNFRQAI